MFNSLCCFVTICCVNQFFFRMEFFCEWNIFSAKIIFDRRRWLGANNFLK